LFRFAWRIFNDLKIRTKLFLSFIIVVFIPVITVGYFLTAELRDMALDNAVEQTVSNMERVKQRTLEIINVSSDTAYRLANDPRLESVANRRYETTYEVVAAYRDYHDFSHFLSLYEEISNIRFYMDNPTLLNNWEFLQPTDDIREADWYKRAMGSLNGTVGWFYLEDERDKRHYLSLVRKVNFFETLSSGVLVVNVNMNALSTILNQETFETMIVDASNTIVSANRFENVGKTLDEIEFDRAIASERSGSFDERIDGESHRVMIEPLVPSGSMNELRIITIFSIDHITADVSRIQRTALIVIAATLVLALVLIFAFSGILSNRMRKLSKHITKVSTGKLDISLEIDGKDEIAMLARQFNSMVGSINELVEEVHDSNQQKRLLESKQNEIKFKMMASQINPHFLFNALESIRMKAHLKGEKEISQVVRLLGKLMRKNLEVSRRKTTLEDEFDIVRCYLDIQKFRYEDRLRYALNIEPEAEHVPIPPLIIQPLVENAVIHGLENKEEGGTVTVNVRFLDAGELLVEVVDDGAGMSDRRIEELLDSLRETDDDDRNRIGLRNVHMRLQLTYGNGHGLHIESASGEGTRIYFTIPLGGEKHV